MSNQTEKKLILAIEAKDMEAVIAVLAQDPGLLKCDFEGITVMHLACECDFPELVVTLAHMGFSVNALDANG
jgi:hypothetical protein